MDCYIARSTSTDGQGESYADVVRDYTEPTLFSDGRPISTSVLDREYWESALLEDTEKASLPERFDLPLLLIILRTLSFKFDMMARRYSTLFSVGRKC